MRKVLLRPAGGAEGDAIEVALERCDDERPARYSVTVGNHQAIADLERIGATFGRVGLDGRIRAYHAVRRDATIEVWIEGRRHVLEIVDRTARRVIGAGAVGAASDLTAPMPGKILRINAAGGEAFERTTLIVMESMKMELTLSAPAAGRVKELLCVEGDLVEMGEILARLEPEADVADAAGSA